MTKIIQLNDKVSRHHIFDRSSVRTCPSSLSKTDPIRFVCLSDVPANAERESTRGGKNYRNKRKAGRRATRSMLALRHVDPENGGDEFGWENVLLLGKLHRKRGSKIT